MSAKYNEIIYKDIISKCHLLYNNVEEAISSSLLKETCDSLFSSKQEHSQLILKLLESYNVIQLNNEGCALGDCDNSKFNIFSIIEYYECVDIREYDKLLNLILNSALNNNQEEELLQFILKSKYSYKLLDNMNIKNFYTVYVNNLFEISVYNLSFQLLELFIEETKESNDKNISLKKYINNYINPPVNSEDEDEQNIIKFLKLIYKENKDLYTISELDVILNEINYVMVSQNILINISFLQFIINKRLVNNNKKKGLEKFLSSVSPHKISKELSSKDILGKLSQLSY